MSGDPGLRAAAQAAVTAYDEPTLSDTDHWMTFDDAINVLRTVLAGPCPDHNPNSGPGSDQCLTCGKFAPVPMRFDDEGTLLE